MLAAPPSCRQVIVEMESRASWSASRAARKLSPGTQKTVSTPWIRSASIRTRPPVRRLLCVMSVTGRARVRGARILAQNADGREIAAPPDPVWKFPCALALMDSRLRGNDGSCATTARDIPPVIRAATSFTRGGNPCGVDRRQPRHRGRHRFGVAEGLIRRRTLPAACLRRGGARRNRAYRIARRVPSNSVAESAQSRSRPASSSSAIMGGRTALPCRDRSGGGR